MTIYIDEVYTSSEVPEPISYEFQDSDGATMTELDDADWACIFRFRAPSGDTSETTADLEAGTATWTPETGDLEDAGVYQGEFTASNDTNVFVSDRIVWRVRAAIPAPAGS